MRKISRSVLLAATIIPMLQKRPCTKGELAAKGGVSHSTITDWVNGLQQLGLVRVVGERRVRPSGTSSFLWEWVPQSDGAEGAKLR